MKKVVFLFVFMGMLWTQYSQAQVCISKTNDSPDASAILEVKASSLGLLPPRVADTNAVSAPAEGLQIYDLSSHCMRIFNGSKWSGCIGCGGSSGSCKSSGSGNVPNRSGAGSAKDDSGASPAKRTADMLDVEDAVSE